MNKQITMTAVLLLICWQQGYAEEHRGELMLNVSGMESDQGQVVANLFCKDQDVMKPESACQHVSTAISNKHATLVFHHLPYGSYAVSLFHDENGNQTLDHNLLHFPAEPLGFSNGFELGLFSGLPSFEKLQFSFMQDKMSLDIVVK